MGFEDVGRDFVDLLLTVTTYGRSKVDVWKGAGMLISYLFNLTLY